MTCIEYITLEVADPTAAALAKDATTVISEVTGQR
jgi:hypothetical protein